MYQNTEPARYWQQQLIEWGPKVLFAILILIVTHFVAKAVQWGIAKLIDRIPVLKRHPGVGGHVGECGQLGVAEGAAQVDDGGPVAGVLEGGRGGHVAHPSDARMRARTP